MKQFRVHLVCSGKTVTLVEAIKQIEKTQASCHILACAPSNSAADLLCKKILEHVDEHKVYRMYASSRAPNFVPEELKVRVNAFEACCLFSMRSISFILILLGPVR